MRPLRSRANALADEYIIESPKILFCNVVLYNKKMDQEINIINNF